MPSEDRPISFAGRQSYGRSGEHMKKFYTKKYTYENLRTLAIVHCRFGNTIDRRYIKADIDLKISLLNIMLN